MADIRWDYTHYPPDDAFPIEMHEQWTCECGAKNEAIFYAGEPGDGDFDSYHFTCTCGRFFKKWARVPKEWVTRSGWCSVPEASSEVTLVERSDHGPGHPSS